MNKIILLAFIPLILAIGLSMNMPTANAQVMAQLVTDNPKLFEPNGLGLAILEHNEWPTTPYDYLKENLLVLSPLAQLRSGISPFDIQCKNDLELLIKSSKESSACVYPNSVMKFIERNWIHVFEPAVALAAAGVESEDEESDSETEESVSNMTQRQSYPSDDQRAMSFTVNFSGASLTTDQMEPIYTFSKFKHLSKVTDATIVLPEKTTDRPQFILESLPSLDKKPYYKMLTEWIAGTPQAIRFDVRVDVVAGNGETIQSWVYKECNAVDYYTFLSESLGVFAFHQKFESEIREKASYDCLGFKIEVPE